MAANEFAGDAARPAIGAAGYIVAAMLGWLVHPYAAAAIFIVIVAYTRQRAKASGPTHRTSVVRVPAVTSTRD